jgi:hypothetical protein
VTAQAPHRLRLLFFAEHRFDIVQPLASYRFSPFNQQQCPISVQHLFSWLTSATITRKTPHEIPLSSARRRIKERNCREFEANSGKPELEFWNRTEQIQGLWQS